ncbi:MAG: RING finger protein [Brevinematia bacterium]
MVKYKNHILKSKKNSRILNKNIKPPKYKNLNTPEIKFIIDNSKITGICPICSQNTFQDPSNIIIDNHIFHFDCIISLIKEHHNIEQNNKIIYIGSNNFGIFWEGKSGRKLELLRRIPIIEEVKNYVKINS